MLELKKVAQSALETLGAAREDTGLGLGRLGSENARPTLMVAVRSTRRFSVTIGVTVAGKGLRSEEGEDRLVAGDRRAMTRD